MKKPFKTYYFLAYEGHAEFILFAHLKNRFKKLFEDSNIKFRELTDSEVFSNGKIKGVKSLKDFEEKYLKIKNNNEYKDLTFLFFLDEDLYHSPEIGKKISEGGDLIQFIKYNSEFILLKLSGYEIKDISEFKPDFQGFRDYCKEEFRKKHGQDLKYIINDDFLDSILGSIPDETIKENFKTIFSLCNK